MKPYTWQKAIMATDADPLTKLVCYTLSNYLNNAGDYAHPGKATIARGAGISTTSVKKHVALAVEAGLLRKEAQTRANGSHTSNRYYPIIPDRLVLEALGQQATPPRAAGDLGVGREATPHNRPLEQTTEEVDKKTEQKKPAASASLPLPNWLKPESWATWVQHRAEIKKPLTETAAKMTLKKLATLREQGYDPDVLIEHAIEAGWQGIYATNEAKTGPTPARPGAPAPRYDENTKNKKVY